MSSHTGDTARRYKLRVNFVGTDAYESDGDVLPFRKLIYLANANDRVGDVRLGIKALFTKLYPEDGQHAVILLRDSFMCDVADDYLVSDVFDESPIVYAAMPGLVIPFEASGPTSNDSLLSPNDSINSYRHYPDSLTKRRRYTLTSLRITDSPTYPTQHTSLLRCSPNRRKFPLRNQQGSPEPRTRTQHSSSTTLPRASPELLPYFNGATGSRGGKDGRTTFAMSCSEAWADIEPKEHSSPALTCLPMQPSSPSPGCDMDSMSQQLALSAAMEHDDAAPATQSLGSAQAEPNQPASAGTTVTSTPVVPAATIAIVAAPKPDHDKTVADSNPASGIRAASAAPISGCAMSRVLEKDSVSSPLSSEEKSESLSSEEECDAKDGSAKSNHMDVDEGDKSAVKNEPTLALSTPAEAVFKGQGPTPPTVVPTASTPAPVAVSAATAVRNAPAEDVTTAMAALQAPSTKPETENSASASSDDASSSGSESESESETDSESETGSESGSSEEESDSAALNTIRTLAGKGVVVTTTTANAKPSNIRVAVARPPPANKGATRAGNSSAAPSAAPKRKVPPNTVSSLSDSSDDLDSDIASDSENKKRPKPPALNLPGTTRRGSLLDMVKSQKSALGLESPGIMSISQMASAKPFDELRKTMAKIAAARASQSIPPTPTTALPHTSGAAPSHDSSDSDTDSDSDSDSSSGSSSDSSGCGDVAPEAKMTLKEPVPQAKRKQPIRFAGATTPTASARARRRKSALLNL